MEMIDVRCPMNPSRLFCRIGRTARLVADNLIEIACRDCRKTKQAEGVECKAVLHRYNALGELVDTEYR